MAEHKIPQKIEHVGDEIPEKLFFNYMFDTYNIDKTTFLEFADLYAEGIRGLPISVLRVSHLSGLESIVKYLRENKKLSYKDISVLLHRNPKTLAVSYAVSKRKKPESLIEIDTSGILIPFNIFSEELSILESICTHLKSLGHSYAEIGRLVGRDQRTVWTVCDRARKKSSLTRDTDVDKKIIEKKAEELFDISSETFFNQLSIVYNIGKQKFLGFVERKNDTVDGFPISVLRVSHLSGLESIVKYLRENKKLSYKDISVLLHRNPKTLAVSYAVSKRKRQESYKEFFDKDIARIPFTSFSENLSILESICTHLKSLGHSYAEIGRLVGRDQRTVWTVCDRARKKLSIQKDNYEKR